LSAALQGSQADVINDREGAVKSFALTPRLRSGTRFYIPNMHHHHPAARPGRPNLSIDNPASPAYKGSLKCPIN
jgi:hypothetical protein